MQRNRTNYPPRPATTSLLLALTLALTGCASSPTSVRLADDTWQSAEFVRAVDSAPIELPLVRDCRAGRDESSSASIKYALVKQRNYESKFLHTTRYWIVPTDNLDVAKAGAQVLIGMKGCQAMQMPV